MKNCLKALIALLLVFVCVIGCASCNNNNNTGDGNDTGDQGDRIPAADDTDAETYRIRFAYSYTALVVNKNDRKYMAKDVVTVDNLYIPVDNDGLTDEDKAKIANITYHGFTFEKWFSEWDTETQTGVEGKEFTFPDGPITGDITLYGDKGNKAGPNATWEISYEYDEEGVVATADGEEEREPSEVVLTISGTGKMFDFKDANEVDVPWYGLVGSITKVVVADGITSIGSNAFNGLTKLDDVTLPDTIEVIGDAAFRKCAIRSFVAPANLKTIEKNAFNATPLRDVVLNEGLTTLADQAFYASKNIRKIIVPASLNFIGNSCFHPGAANASHALANGQVFYSGTSEQFASFKSGGGISMDNTWFADLASIYYYTEDEAVGNTGNYWHYAEGTTTPVQYCYTLSYTQGSSALPFYHIYVPAEPMMENGEVVLDEDGLPILSGIITAEILAKQDNIRYHGYHFDTLVGSTPIALFDTILADRNYNCRRGQILSEDGGIIFSYDNASGTLTISKDASTEARIRSKVETAIKRELVTLAERNQILAEVKAEIAAGTLVLAAKQTAETVTAERVATLANERFANADNQARYNKEVADRLAKAYRIWDFVDFTDTGSLWTGKLSTINDVKTLVFDEGVEYVGKFTFSGLTGIKEVVLPNSINAPADASDDVKALYGIHADAFDGCSALVSVFFSGDYGVKFSGVNAESYTYAEESTSETGNYWTVIDGKRVAWSLNVEAGTLMVGGDNVMVNFASPEDAPWYAAKDSITSVSFASNVTALGENVVNGYANVVTLKLPSALRKIPASALADTGIVNDTSKYENGLLVVNNHLIRVDVASKNNYMFETFVGLVTIAGGAFNGCDNVKSLYISRTVQYINADAFAGCDIDYIYSDNGVDYWSNIESVVDFGDAKVYFKSQNKPFGDNTADKYWYKSGDEYVIWG